MYFLNKRVKNLYAKAMEKGCDVAERFHDGLMDPRIVKSFAIEQPIVDRITKSYKEEMRFEIKADTFQNIAGQINSFIILLSQVVFLWIGYSQVEAGALTTGGLVFLFFLQH